MNTTGQCVAVPEPGSSLLEYASEVLESVNQVRWRCMRGRPGQDGRDRTAGTGRPGQDNQERTTETGHLGQDRQDRPVLLRNANMV